jgi:phosphonate transport system ATP-binding protein
MNALSVENLYKRYPNGTEALKGVSFSIEPGEFVVLLGPNGSGKSTLLRTIVALEKATKGSILLDGTEITTAENTSLRKIRKRAGFIFQKFNLIKNLSVFHNVLIGAMGKSHSPINWWPATATDHVRLRVLECLERVNLAHLMNQRLDTLSGGQMQRVAIARMLMQEPDIILADEPVASLDPKSGEDVMNLLAEIAKEEKLTVICTLHQIDFAIKYASRIIGLNEGRIVIDDKVANIDKEMLQGLYGFDPVQDIADVKCVEKYA